MDAEGLLRELEAAIETQLRIAAGDEAVMAAADSLLAALAPAVREAVRSLAEQAAAEVGAQLPDQTVDVVIADGEPTLVVRTVREPVTVSTEDLEARLTVRLPNELKQHLEVAAGEMGDSINTYVVKTLTERTKRSTRRQGRFSGTINT